MSVGILLVRQHPDLRVAVCWAGREKAGGGGGEGGGGADG